VYILRHVIVRPARPAHRRSRHELYESNRLAQCRRSGSTRAWWSSPVSAHPRHITGNTIAPNLIDKLYRRMSTAAGLSNSRAEMPPDPRCRWRSNSDRA